jgi:hypothetical protein
VSYHKQLRLGSPYQDVEPEAPGDSHDRDRTTRYIAAQYVDTPGEPVQCNHIRVGGFDMKHLLDVNDTNFARCTVTGKPIIYK